MLRLLAPEGMVSLGTLSLDGTTLAGNAAQKANRALPQIDELLAEAAAADALPEMPVGGQPSGRLPPAVRAALAAGKPLASTPHVRAWRGGAGAGGLTPDVILARSRAVAVGEELASGRHEAAWEPQWRARRRSAGPDP